MKLADLLSCADLTCHGKYCEEEITSIEVNTANAIKNKQNNPLFVCIVGSLYDTHKDIEKLILSGIRHIVALDDIKIPTCAADIIPSTNTRKSLALLSRAFYGCPDKKLCMIAVTGTKGKTTVTYMLESILRESGIKCGIIGTNGIIYNGNTFECDNSTPGSIEYYYHLSQMAEHGIKCVVCEVTSQALKQFRTYGTVFDIAAYTNLYPDHIGKHEHQSFDEYKGCKGLLFGQCKKAVINRDCPHSHSFCEICNEKGVSYSTFAVNETALYKCTDIAVSDKGSNFRVDDTSYNVSLPGSFNISNAMCALSIARELGVDDKYIYKGLCTVSVCGRCERVENPCGIDIVIDYAHTGKSLENILKALREECHGKLYCVFGAGGNRSPLRRIGMGRAASEYADYSIITNDNPRYEDPTGIIDDIIKGMNEGSYTVIPDREQAIHYALSVAKKGDTVLLAGKGAQNYQEICGIKYPFDEREAVSRYYKSKIIQQ